MKIRNRLLNVILFSAAYLITCIAVATGAYFREGLVVSVGEVSDRKIKATSVVENKIATERNRVEAAARAENMNPNLTKDDTVKTRVDDNLQSLFTKLDAIRLSYVRETAEREAALQDAALAWQAAQEAQTRSSAEAAQDNDVLSQAANETEPPLTSSPFADETADIANIKDSPLEAFEMFSVLPVIFTEQQQQYLVTMSQEDYRQLSESVYQVIHAALEQGIQDLDNKTFLSVQDDFKRANVGEEIGIIGNKIVSAYLLPNVVVNAEATRLEREKIANDYETVWLLKDETIVDEGKKITEEAYAIMESLGMLNTGMEDQFIPMIGAFIVIAGVFVVCLIFLWFYRKDLITQKKEAVLLFMLYCMVLAFVLALGSNGYVFLPLLVFPMLVSMLIDIRASVVLTLGLTVSCYFIVSGTMDYLLFYLIAGTMFALLAKLTTERNKVFMVGLLAALVNFTLCLALALVTEKNNVLNLWPELLENGGYAALNGVFTVIVCIGSLPIWEALFGVVTPVKLLDLTNPTNLLLRRLTIEAPGTYHHSLIVANLAESAAYDIGANPNKARVGGYYHDIGKLKYPQYFIENLVGENPHDSMDPFNSVQIIISHVTYGLTLASEYRLPQFVRDIVQEHHGTSMIHFFYCKAKENPTDLPVNEQDFRYPYMIPQSRESACVMLADTVEAAVRSMIKRVKSVDEVESQIKKLIRDKLNDGQLADSGLSIKDLDTIANSFFRVLKGMYHERIQYPKLTPEPKEIAVEG